MDELLDVSDLRTDIRQRRCTVHAVDGVSLTLGEGQILGLVGESGSGKTMTGMSIVRLLPPGGHIVGGSVTLAGQELTTLSDEAMRQVRGNQIGVVFQDPMTSLNPTMTIGNQIAESVRLHRGASRGEALERAAETLDLVGMPRAHERLGNYPHQLSGGMRQRVMIAMALACEPKLLIADEPTTALDVTIQEQILDLLDELRTRLGMGILLITHDLAVITRYADRVAVMYAGRIVETGPVGMLLRRMRHRYTEALMAAVPRRDQDTGTDLYSIPGLPPDLSDPPVGCRFSPRCQFAQDDCRTVDPPLVTVAPSHEHACFHPVDCADDSGLDGTEPAAGSTLKVTERSASSRILDTQTAPLVEIRNLVKEYPVTTGLFQRRVGAVSAVAGVNFSIASGETFGLVGESGCGKSTLGRALVALEKPTSGSIIFSGHDITAMPTGELHPIRRDLQLMFQDPYASLDPRMRVGAILREPLTIQRIGSRREQDRRIGELLDEVGLRASAAQHYPHEFSGGQRQRIGLARALALEPKLVIADEPVSALDVSIQAQVLNLMRDLRERLGLTYVIISHDLAVVRYMADRIGVMYLGKLVEIGPTTGVCDHPVHPYTEALLRAVPDLDPADPATNGSHAGNSAGPSQPAVRGELPSAINPPSGCRFRTRCPRAQELCADLEPPLRPFGPRHLAACHYPLEEPLSSAIGAAHVKFKPRSSAGAEWVRQPTER
ncbi:MAG TPA: ABC transporter ATP-binding protein [Pseudonocardiaceae bacterium]|nr:ABC transporter ATP-binding protein [Pseudonocardiaceae bacterium]